MTPEPPYGPADAALAPRYSGVRTFARCPYVEDPVGVDVGFVGIPFDTATSYRSGARFGPEAIRAGSSLLRPWHPPLAVDVFAVVAGAPSARVAAEPGAVGVGGAVVPVVPGMHARAGVCQVKTLDAS